jgi:hypothetical protein
MRNREAMRASPFPIPLFVRPCAVRPCTAITGVLQHLGQRPYRRSPSDQAERRLGHPQKLGGQGGERLQGFHHGAGYVTQPGLLSAMLPATSQSVPAPLPIK